MKALVFFALILVFAGCIKPVASWSNIYEAEHGTSVELEGFLAENTITPKNVFSKDENTLYLWKDEIHSTGIALIVEKEIECSGKAKVEGTVEKKKIRTTSTTLQEINWLTVKAEKIYCLE